MYKSICIHGLGYVGVPLAVAFAEKGHNVIGYDNDESKIREYRKGNDVTNEVGNNRIANKNLVFTSDNSKVGIVDYHIVAVPTPIDEFRSPNMEYVISATKNIGEVLCKGDYVIYESTVCPGATRSCIKILEEISGLKCIEDFKVGFSPERVAPATEVKLEDIVKVVSGVDEESLNKIAELYETIIDAGVYKAESIEIAEACKIMENIQRDVNIALMNEFSKVFNNMNIDTNSVIRAASTKWNFNEYYPGLVGGHCIGIDPYYLMDYANSNEVKIPIISSARNTNENLVNDIFKKIRSVNGVDNKRVALLGLTFKEDCNDLRNSKVKDLFDIFGYSNSTVFISDPIADEQQVFNEYGINLTKIEDLENIDYVIVCVKHKEYMNLNKEFFDNICGESKLLFDIKGIYNKEDYSDYVYLKL